MGVDFGAKRIGIAVSNPEGTIAFPREIIEGGAGAVQRIADSAKREEAETIVVGLPLGQGGKDTDQTMRVRAFARELRRVVSMPIEFENELLTTRLARIGTHGSKSPDASAAALILQSYLDKQHVGI